MTFSIELKALAVLPEPNQPPHLEFLVVDHQVIILTQKPLHN